MKSGLSLGRLGRQALPYFLSPAGHARPPLTVYWSINSACNLACKMCDVGMGNRESNFSRNLQPRGGGQSIPLELFRSVVDEVAPHQPMIAITSTEPLLYKPLCEAIAHVRSRGLEMAVTTNGWLLPDLADDLAAAGLTRLNVSIDGPPGVHDFIRGREGAFARAVEGTARLKEAAARRGLAVETLCACTVTNLNQGHLADFLDALPAAAFDRVHFSFMCFVTPQLAAAHNARWGQAYLATVTCLGEHARPEAVDADRLHAELEGIRRRNDPRVHLARNFTREELHDYFHRPERFLSGARCMASWFIAEIIASGEVIPYTRCYHATFGNIHEEPFLEIWNGPRMRAWRRDVRRPRRFPACPRCDQCL